jgi:heptosyltransferase-1
MMPSKLSVPPRFLLMKTSSMGDVLHNLAVVSDLRRVYPSALIDWCAEEPFAEIPAWHRGVRRVIAVAIRRWREQPFNGSTWRDIGRALSALRSEPYDAIIDTQGLVRTALLGRLAHGPVYGQNWHEARESLAGLLVTHPLAVPYALHAVERYRMIAAQACGYARSLPALPLDFGLADRFPRRPGKEAFLFTNTSRDLKLWPEAHWIALGQKLRTCGYQCVLTAGNPAETERADRITRALGAGEILIRPTLTQLAERLANGALCVGVDTGFTHLAWVLGIPTIGVFTDTDPALAGGFGAGLHRTFGDLAACPPIDDVIGQLTAWNLLTP